MLWWLPPPTTEGLRLVTGCHLSQRLLQRWSQRQALHVHLGDLLALGSQLRVVGPDQHVVRAPQLQGKQRRSESAPGFELPNLQPHSPALHHHHLLQPGAPPASPAPGAPSPAGARGAAEAAGDAPTSSSSSSFGGKNTSFVLRSTTFHRSWSSSRSSEPSLAPLVPAVVTKRITR